MTVPKLRRSPELPAEGLDVADYPKTKITMFCHQVFESSELTANVPYVCGQCGGDRRQPTVN